MKAGISCILCASWTHDDPTDCLCRCSKCGGEFDGQGNCPRYCPNEVGDEIVVRETTMYMAVHVPTGRSIVANSRNEAKEKLLRLLKSQVAGCIDVVC